MLDIVFGIIILGVAVFIAVRVLGNITLGIVLIGLVLLASYLIMGGFPNLQSIPMIGQYLPKIPRTTGEAIATIKSTLYNIEILGLSRDSDNNLLINVANTGKMNVSNFTVVIDDKLINILNKPEDPLNPRNITVIETNWKEDFNKIIVQTDQANVSYSIG
jgi:hypothetical protein